jgi:group II intron reverse transcriptase/maturase
MSQETFIRLEHLRRLNSNETWVNYDVYRLLYREDLYIVAYERIKSKPGNMTPGTDEETLDGFSLQAIREIIRDMRTEQFRFKPVRTTFILKTNGKMRKLGIPCVRDKVVQEVIHMLLEAIYDSPNAPYFQETSHGFRPGRSCHTALREFREKWSAVNWIVEGDIRACFDELDHRVLVSLLHKKIHDQRFLSLIWKLLKAGYMDLHGTKRESLIGSPQGSLVSPILANLYLNKLDKFVEDVLIPQYTKGKKRKSNPAYEKLMHSATYQARKGRKEQAQALRKQAQQLPSIDPNDPHYRRLRYVRYADDFLLGFIGPKEEAEEIKQQLRTFLQEELKLNLSEEKTLITHAKTETARFLNYEVHTIQKNAHRDQRDRRSLNGTIGLRVPREVIKDT